MLQRKETIVESKDREIRVTKDLMERKSVMSEMLAPLSADKKDVMQQLLESVKTPQLRNAYEKYLPAVMEGEKVVKAAKVTLTEGTEITGDKEGKPQVGLDNILDIRKLAGLK
jgi:hypothetical protein